MSLFSLVVLCVQCCNIENEKRFGSLVQICRRKGWPAEERDLSGAQKLVFDGTANKQCFHSGCGTENSGKHTQIRALRAQSDSADDGG